MRSSTTALGLAACMLVALMGAPSGAAAAPDFSQPMFTEFAGGATPGFSANFAPAGITSGPDGNLWFGATGGPGRIVRFTPQGAATEFVGGVTPNLTAGRGPANAAPGPDGNVWVTEFTDPGGLVKITPSGAVTDYPILPANTNPAGITAGSDGNLWFVSFANPGRITKVSTSGAVTEVAAGGTTPTFTANRQPRGAALGPDGNVWFTEFASPGGIGRVTPAGVVTEFTGGVTPGLSPNRGPVGITAGSDGNLWFTEQSGGGSIGRITPGGVVTEFPLPTPGRQPGIIASGPDGNLWFTELASPGGIGRITPGGVVTEFTAGATAGFTADRVPVGITTGADGNLWFTETAEPGAIVRISPAPEVVVPTTPPTTLRMPNLADTTPPETTITSGPADGDPSAKTAASYAFTSSEPGSTFQCRAFDASGNPELVTETFTACDSPATVPPPSRPQIGAFEVRAVDPAGNADPTPAVRHLITHGTAGPPAKPSACRLIAVDRSHGKGARLLPGCRLARIQRGKVRCLQVDTLKTGTCAFDRQRSKWLESRSGPDYAIVGQALPAKSGATSPWVVAATRTSANTVPCQKPPATAKRQDTAGRVSSGSELGTTCVVEEALQRWNAMSAYGWTPLVNDTNLEICSSNRPGGVLHPDGVPPIRLLPGGAGACYTGPGAGLNDLNGTERDGTGTYLTGATYCHYIVSGGLEIPAAKRPASRYPKVKDANGKTHLDLTRREVDPATPIVWRAVDPKLKLANGPPRVEGEPTPAPQPIEAP